MFDNVNIQQFFNSFLNNPNPDRSTPILEVTCSRNFVNWLQTQQISFALTTYKSSRLMLVGVNKQGNFSGLERLFERAMGLYAVDSERFYLGTRYQLWQFDNVLEPGQLYNGYDKLYIPRIGYTTGDLELHDIAVDSSGRVIFVATQLNSLATVSDRHSCKPLWYPEFISKVINEDRCHLNGLAMVDGQPSYVTACSRTDIIDGWREKRHHGGCVIDVASQKLVITGLSMPHSPRWYRDKLWILNSGTGEFGWVDLDRGEFNVVTFCPGYLRGLAFWQDWAIVGLSKPRERTFTDLLLQERLSKKRVKPRCGLMVIDLKTGAIVEWLRLEGTISELYDLQVLPGVQRPMALGFKNDDISRLLTLDTMDSL